MKADFAQRREVGYYGCFMNADIISLQKVSHHNKLFFLNNSK